MKITIKIRWVIAHEPLSLFVRAAASFTKAINERAVNHKIEVEIMTLGQYSLRYNDGVEVTKHDLLDLMNAGKIEMSQMYTTWLAEKYSSDMHVLDMPFLFRDHDHAQTVLEGAVGNELLAGLAAKSNILGLAFTYSGGFRMIPANKAIRSLEDFKGTSIRSNKNQFAMETFRAVGAIPVARELEEINEGVADGTFVGGESAWPRVYPLEQNKFSTVMNDTKHSLFLTSMIIEKKFWSTLDKELQDLMRAAAVDAAREERAESIRDGEEAKIKAKKEGIEIVTLSDAEMSKFSEATKVVYEKFDNFFSPGLIQRIKQ
ncbi:MAG: TRAP transporter substrate-binding protein [Bacteriovorax sp.]|nr:TRAP transporter substrate-binding protein [Bacteriovorax sp.]